MGEEEEKNEKSFEETADDDEWNQERSEGKEKFCCSFSVKEGRVCAQIQQSARLLI